MNMRSSCSLVSRYVSVACEAYFMCCSEVILTIGSSNAKITENSWSSIKYAECDGESFFEIVVYHVELRAYLSNRPSRFLVRNKRRIRRVDARVCRTWCFPSSWRIDIRSRWRLVSSWSDMATRAVVDHTTVICDWKQVKTNKGLRWSSSTYIWHMTLTAERQRDWMTNQSPNDLCSWFCKWKMLHRLP